MYHFLNKGCPLIAQNLHAALSRCPPDKLNGGQKAKKRGRFKMCKSPANWLMHPEKMHSRRGVSAPKKCFGPEKMFRQNWRRLSAIWQPAVTCGSNISFSQIFLSGCQEISVWSETNPVNRFVCVSFGPVWVWHGDTIAIARCINYQLDVTTSETKASSCMQMKLAHKKPDLKDAGSAFPLNLHPVRQITTVGCLIM